MKKKLKLDQLKVQSLVTNLEKEIANTAKGGYITHYLDPYQCGTRVQTCQYVETKYIEFCD